VEPVSAASSAQEPSATGLPSEPDQPGNADEAVQARELSETGETGQAGEHGDADEPHGQDGLPSDHDEGGDTDVGSAEGAEASEGGQDGQDGTGKRKRRRRRKRKDGAAGTAAGEVGAVAGTTGEGGEPKPEQAGQKKKESHAPFAHRFAGVAGNKRHAFAVGEVVAGRVQQVEHGVIVVDLFGKAVAFADEYEPREVPVLPESESEPSSENEVSAEGQVGQPQEAAAEGQENQAEQAHLENPEEQQSQEPSLDAQAPAAEDETAEFAAAESTVQDETSAELPQSVEASESQVEPLAEEILEAGAAEAQPGPDAEVSSDFAGATDTAAVPVQTDPEVETSEELPEQTAHELRVHDVNAAQDEQDENDARYAELSAEDAHQEHPEDAETLSSIGELAAAHHDEEDADEDHDSAAATEPAREKPAAPAIGQVFKGRVGAVSESGHIAILNRLIDAPTVRAELATYREQHKRVHGIVFGYNRGGFDVLVEGLRAFCPASAMSLEDIAEPLDFVGKKLEFLLPASKAGGKDIIVSRRSILERLQRRKTKEFLRGLTPGQKFKGKVTAVRDFGLFVDIGGVEGLVHQSELSYAFGVKPNSVAKVGDEIDVQVLRVGADAKKEKETGKRDRLTRVSLSIKALLPDPWDAHAAALSEGAIHKGKVVRATEFGAFIEIAPEVEGLLHITELGRDLKHASQVVREGEEIYVAVERVDRRARRVSLSKLSPAEVAEFEAGGLSQDATAARNLRQGNNVTIKVERIEPRVIFGRVNGTVGRRGRAFIPSSETGTERGTDLRKRFPIGSEIEAKIIGIDRDGSLKCSVKAMQIDEERQAVKNYRREAAKQGFGTFGDLLRAKLGEAQK